MIRYGTGTYIVRDDCARDLFGVLDKLKAIGFDGVELLGFSGKTPEAIRKHADRIQLTIMGDHVGADAFLRDPKRVLADHVTLGVETMVISWPSDTPRLPGTSAYNALVGQIAGLCEACMRAGITPLFHNHGGDFATTPAHFDSVLDACAHAGMQAEPDIGWMVTAGVDPIFYLEKYKEKTPVLHLKDVFFDNWVRIGDKDHLPLQRGDASRGNFEFRPTGYGVVQNALLAPYYLACGPSWILIDHDCAYERDAYSDLALSLTYAKALVQVTEGSRTAQ
jgi:sugar phosphate isomerase/epimerase